MKIYHFNHPQQYYERVKNYLLQHEAEHDLILGTINNINRYPQRFTEQPILVVVDDPILVVALRTPPRKLILSRAVNTEAIAFQLSMNNEQLSIAHCSMLCDIMGCGAQSNLIGSGTNILLFVYRFSQFHIKSYLPNYWLSTCVRYE